ncbi:hypothetical protein ACFT6Z_25100 [Streptomyces sp. NPDC057131]|uniref:hypothetical protein n=1 Tax=unclassified Streptomyces TaxID=2593676 RepID=UPI003632321E
MSSVFDGADTDRLLATASVVAVLLLITYRGRSCGAFRSSCETDADGVRGYVGTRVDEHPRSENRQVGADSEPGGHPNGMNPWCEPEQRHFAIVAGSRASSGARPATPASSAAVTRPLTSPAGAEPGTKQLPIDPPFAADRLTTPP